MKIPSQLPQFGSEKAFLIVTGKQSAEFLRVYNGNIEELESFVMPKEEFTDREQFFEKKGHGQTLGSGSVYEDQKEVTIRKFLTQLTSKSKKMISDENPDTVYLFAPDYMLKMVRDALPKTAQNLISAAYKGNYTGSHPLDFIKKINTDRKNKELD